MRGLRPFTLFIMTRVVRFLLVPWFVCLAAVCLAIWSLPDVYGSSPPDKRTEELLAPGLRHTRLLRGSTSSSVRYRILVGSFDSQARADAMLARLKNAGVRPRLTTVAFVIASAWRPFPIEKPRRPNERR